MDPATLAPLILAIATGVLLVIGVPIAVAVGGATALAMLVLFEPDQVLSAEEALAGFTAGSARATRSEDETGRLAPGLRADFVVLAEDPLQVPAAQLDALTVRSTWVDGEAVYEAE